MEQRVIGVYFDVSGEGPQAMKIALILRDSKGNLSMRSPANEDGMTVILNHINGIELDYLMQLIELGQRAA